MPHVRGACVRYEPGMTLLTSKEPSLLNHTFQLNFGGRVKVRVQQRSLAPCAECSKGSACAITSLRQCAALPCHSTSLTSWLVCPVVHGHLRGHVRGQVPSVKNFQLVNPAVGEHVVQVQFGKVSGHKYVVRCDGLE